MQYLDRTPPRVQNIVFVVIMIIAIGAQFRIAGDTVGVVVVDLFVMVVWIGYQNIKSQTTKFVEQSRWLGESDAQRRAVQRTLDASRLQLERIDAAHLDLVIELRDDVEAFGRAVTFLCAALTDAQLRRAGDRLKEGTWTLQFAEVPEAEVEPAPEPPAASKAPPRAINRGSPL